MRCFARLMKCDRASLVTMLVVGAAVSSPGCNSAPFHAAVKSGHARPAVAEGHESDGRRADDSGWPGGSRSADGSKSQYHEVRQGETLARLASMYGLSVPQLVSANSLDADEALKPGQILRIPQAR